MNMSKVIGIFDFLTGLCVPLALMCIWFQQLVENIYLPSRLKKSEALQFDQKTRPYILAVFRDIKITNTPEYPRILKRHCKEKLARKAVFQRTY